VLLGEDASGLSPASITRLTATWQEDYRSWNHRSLADRDYVYIWVDGVHFNVRLEDERLACLVVIGARPDGTKEVVALEDGYRESAESWKSLLRNLKKRGMRAPVVAVGDGALGFWAALREVWPTTRDAGLGRLVQQPQAAGADWLRAACGVRASVVSTSGDAGHRGRTLVTESPGDPGAIH
jgi:Transposase, Mutator family